MYFKLIHLHYRHTHFLFKLKSLLHRGKHTHNMVSSVGRINGSRWEGLEEDCLFWRIRCIPKAQIGAECSVILGIWFSFTLCPYPLETVMDKWKERIFKVTKEKSQVTYKGNPICLTDDLSTESLQPRRKWQGTFKVLKGKNLQPRLLYLARISFKIDGKSKSFSDKQKLRELSTIKQALQQMLKGLM